MKYENSTLLINLSSIIDPLVNNTDDLASNAIIKINSIINKYNSDDILVVSSDHYAAEPYVEEFNKITDLLSDIGVNIYTTSPGSEENLIKNIANANKEKETIICSSNKSLYQLINDNLSIYNTSDSFEYNNRNFSEHFNVSPELSRLLFALDDINVEHKLNVGFKTLERYVSTMFTLENILEQLPSERNRHIKKFNNHADQIISNYQKSSEYTDINVGSIKISRDPANVDELRRKLSLYNLDRTIFKENHIISNEEDAKAALHELMSKKVVMINSISSNQDFSAVCVVLPPDKTFTFDLSDKNKFSNKQFFDTFRPFFESNTIKKVCIDAKETCLSMLKNDVELNNVVFDPVQAAYIFDSGKYSNSNLQTIYEDTLKSPMPEEVSHMDIASNKTLGLINLSEQSLDLYHFCSKLKKQISTKDANNSKYYEEVESKLNLIVAKMQYDGITVKETRLESLIAGAEKSMESSSKSISYMLKRKLGKQDLTKPALEEIVREDLGISMPSSKEKSGQNFSERLLWATNNNEGKDPIVNHIVDYDLSKNLLDGLNTLKKHVKNNRINPTFNITKTDTARFSSKDPNAQGFRKNKLRSAIVANENNYLVSIDYSQFELKILAELSNDPILIAAFNNGVDIHKETASKMFDVDYDNVTESQRKMAKAINFGLIYGKGAKALGEDLGLSTNEAKQKIALYYEKFPTVKKFMDKTAADAKFNGYVTTVTNRKIHIPGFDSKDSYGISAAERKSKNSTMQSSAADIMKIAMVNVAAVIKEKFPTVAITNQVHDELVFDVPKDLVIDFSVEIKKVMENAYKLKVPLTVDVEVGKNWWEQKLINMAKYEKEPEAELTH